MKIGVLASVGSHLDSFFPEIIDAWQELGSVSFTAASSSAKTSNFTVIRSLTRRPSLRNVGAHRELSRWVNRNDLDVVLTNTATASALARLAPLSVPVVYCCHGLHWNSGRSISERVWQVVESRLLAKSQGVICMNSDDEAWFSARVEGSKLVRLTRGIGVPLDRFPLADPHVFPTLDLVWIGEFSRRKRPELAVAVIAELRRLDVPVRLTMLGTGALWSQTRSNVSNLGLDDRIELVGHQSVADHIIKSHALIHTASWEGLPRAMLEAYAMGRPAFGFDVKGVRDIPGAILSEDGNVAAMAQIIAANMPPESMYVASPLRHGLSSKDAGASIHTFLQRVEEQGRIEATTQARKSHRRPVSPWSARFTQ